VLDILEQELPTASAKFLTSTTSQRSRMEASLRLRCQPRLTTTRWLPRFHCIFAYSALACFRDGKCR